MMKLTRYLLVIIDTLKIIVLLIIHCRRKCLFYSQTCSPVAVISWNWDFIEKVMRCSPSISYIGRRKQATTPHHHHHSKRTHPPILLSSRWIPVVGVHPHVPVSARKLPHLASYPIKPGKLAVPAEISAIFNRTVGAVVARLSRPLQWPWEVNTSCNGHVVGQRAPRDTQQPAAVTCIVALSVSEKAGRRDQGRLVDRKFGVR